MNNSDYVIETKVNTTVACDKIVVHNDPLKYGFVGWSINPNDTNGEKEITVGEEDMTVYAIFKEKECAVTIVNKSTSSNEIYLEITTKSAASGTHFEWFNCNGEQEIHNGVGYIRLYDLNNNSSLILVLGDETFYKISGSYSATLYSNNTWHIDEINEKLGDYNICYSEEIEEYIFEFDSFSSSLKNVSASATSHEIHIRSLFNGIPHNFTTLFVSENPWVTIDTESGSVSDDITVVKLKFDANTGEERKCEIEFVQDDSGKIIHFILTQRAVSITRYVVNWRFEDNRTVGDSIQTFTVTLNDGITFGGGGGLNNNGGYRTGNFEITEGLINTPLVVQNVEIAPLGSHPTFTWVQSPNPYYYNRGAAYLLVSITD